MRGGERSGAGCSGWGGGGGPIAGQRRSGRRSTAGPTPSARPCRESPRGRSARGVRTAAAAAVEVRGSARRGAFRGHQRPRTRRNGPTGRRLGGPGAAPWRRGRGADGAAEAGRRVARTGGGAIGRAGARSARPDAGRSGPACAPERAPAGRGSAAADVVRAERGPGTASSRSGTPGEPGAGRQGQRPDREPEHARPGGRRAGRATQPHPRRPHEARRPPSAGRDRTNAPADRRLTSAGQDGGTRAASRPPARSERPRRASTGQGERARVPPIRPPAAGRAAPAAPHRPARSGRTESMVGDLQFLHGDVLRRRGQVRPLPLDRERVLELPARGCAGARRPARRSRRGSARARRRCPRTPRPRSSRTTRTGCPRR